MALATFEIAALTNRTTGAEDASRTYAFQDLQGTVPEAAEQTEVIRRPGVDFPGLRTLGIQGPEFTLVSVEFVASRSAAKDQIELYRALTADSNGIKITQADEEFFPADVLGVTRAGTVQAVGQVAGALVGSPNFMLRVAWRLVLSQEDS